MVVIVSVRRLHLEVLSPPCTEKLTKALGQQLCSIFGMLESHASFAVHSPRKLAGKFRGRAMVMPAPPRVESRTTHG
jgi:hypothetical protein